MLGKCAACKFFVPNKDTFPQGLCKRYPPSRHLVPTPQGFVVMAGFPPMPPTEECGEFKPRVEVVRE